MEAAQALRRAHSTQPALRALPADGAKPTREQVERAATALIERRGAEVLRHAQRFARRPQDAEDAYQRGLEILLTKAPTTEEDRLVPWLKTVVMREVFEINERNARAGELDEIACAQTTDGTVPQDHVERYERLRVGAEAIGRLKANEIRALLLRAEGHSYGEIQDVTGWSHTKVNRLLTEGRRSFLGHVEGIESGADCARFEPLISAFADGESDARTVLSLRRHLRSCPGCRTTVRQYRSAPRELAAVVGPIGVVAGSPGVPAGRLLDQVQVWIGERAGLLAVKLQGAADLSTGGKLLAVAASSAALAGGGAALEEAAIRDPDRKDRTTRTVEQERPVAPVAAPSSEVAQTDAGPANDRPDDRHGANDGGHANARQPDEAAPAEPAPAGEFEPSGAPVGGAGASDSGSGSGPNGGAGSRSGSAPNEGSSRGGASSDGSEFAP